MSPGLLTSVLIRLFMAFKSAALQNEKQNTAEAFPLMSGNTEEQLCFYPSSLKISAFKTLKPQTKTVLTHLL